MVVCDSWWWISTQIEIKTVKPDEIFSRVETEAGSVAHQVEDYDDRQSQNGIAGNLWRLTLISILEFFRLARRGCTLVFHHLSELDVSWSGWPVMVRRLVGGMQADRVIVAATGSEDIFSVLKLFLSLTSRNSADWKIFWWWHRYKYLSQPGRWTELSQCRVILTHKHIYIYIYIHILLLKVRSYLVRCV